MKSSRWAPQAAPATSQPEPPTLASPPPQEPSAPESQPAEQQAAVPTPIEPEQVEQPLAQEIQAETIPLFDPSMDEFAQTREDDDLFDDDVVLVEESTPVPDVPVEPVQEPPAPGKQIPTGPAAHGRGRGGGRGRGRGRGRGHDANRGRDQDLAQQPAAKVAPTTPVTSESQAEGTVEVAPPSEAAPGASEPATATPRKEAAVRGDRSGTGGVKKAKLTDAELTQRIANISLKNASLTAAHAKAEADAASFEAREARAAHENAKRRQAAAARQKEDKLNRSEMLSEREKNRLRKMNAAGVREWDAEKDDAGFTGTGNERGGRAARRGAHGGVVGARDDERGDASPVLEEPSVDVNSHAPSGPAFRARGGRGRGRGAARGARGDANGAPAGQKRETPQSVPTATDFPDLPAAPVAAAKNGEEKNKEPARAPAPLTFPKKSAPTVALDSPDTPVDGKRSWADQVEREGI